MKQGGGSSIEFTMIWLAEELKQGEKKEAVRLN